MMKKIVLTVFLLSMVVVANAGMTIVIKGDDGGWYEHEESTYTITPSTEIEIGIMGEGTIGSFGFGVFSGLGSIGDNVAAMQDGVTAMLTNDAVTAASLGVQNPFISMAVDVAPVDGILITAPFHCDGPGDVTLAVIDLDTGFVLDTQVIHQVPEPATLAILGIGGLFLRRRRIA